jgi:hypothetical protein
MQSSQSAWQGGIEAKKQPAGWLAEVNSLAVHSRPTARNKAGCMVK